MKQNPTNILERIVKQKKITIAKEKKVQPLTVLKKQLNNHQRPFKQALKKRIDAKKNAVIAEIKKASPSRGVLSHDFDVANIAKNYQQGGAICLSVLTDTPFFQGHNDNIKQAKDNCQLPVLRKDFIIDAYQVYQSNVIGADCILLIAAILDDKQLQSLKLLAEKLGMAVLVEVHHLIELKRVLALGVTMVGINNRDLTTFKVDLNTTINLLAHIGDDITVITESGIHTNADIALMNKHHIYGFLVGESLMRAGDNSQHLLHSFEKLSHE